MQGPQLHLNTQIKTRSASGIPEIRKEETKPASSKEKSRVKKFLTKVGSFFKNIFGFGRKKTTQIHPQSNIQGIQNSQIKTNSNQKVDPRQQKLEVLTQTINKLNNPNFKENIKILNLIKEYSNLDLKSINIDQINVFQKRVNNEIMTHTKSSVNELKQNVNKTITRFIKNTHSKLQEKMAPIQKTICQRINTMQEKRDMKAIIKKDLSLDTNEELDQKYQKLLDLYTEKELKSTFTTSMGTVYDNLDPSKEDLGWAGRTDSDIDNEILVLLEGKDELKLKYDNKIGTLFRGISSYIQSEAELLIESVKENDKVMANIKAVQLSLASIQETEHGISDVLQEVDDTHTLSAINKCLELATITENMNQFSEAYIEGFTQQTHVSQESIKEKVIQIASKSQSYSNEMNSQQQEEFITDLTEYLTSRYEKKGVLQSRDKDHYSINKDAQKDFVLRSNDKNKHKTWSKLFDIKEKTGMLSSHINRGEYSEKFKQIESVLENKIKEKEDILAQEDVSSLINDSIENRISSDDDFVSYLTDYTMDRLAQKNVVSYEDSGSVLAEDKAINVRSHKKDFTKSKLQTDFIFKKAFKEMESGLSTQINTMIKTAYSSKGLTSKVEIMTKKLKKSNSYFEKTATNLKVNTRLTYNKIITASNPIKELKTSYNELKESVQSLEKSLYEDSTKVPSAADRADDTIITHLNTAQEQIDSSQDQINQVADQLKVKTQEARDLKSKEDDKQASEFERLSTKLLNETGITDIAAGILSGDTPTDEQLAQLQQKSTSILQTIDQMKSLVSDHADKADMLIEQIPYAGQIYSAAKILNYISNAHDKGKEITQLRNMIATVKTENLDTIYSQDDSRIDNFSNLMQKKDEASELFADIVFSSLNLASSPLGVSVGSFLKQAYNLNKAGTLNDDQYKQISKNIMTLNDKYHNMASQSKEDAAHDFVDHLRQGNIEKNWDSVCDSFMSYSLVGVDSTTVKKEILGSNI
jgi:hypothetical protein